MNAEALDPRPRTITGPRLGRVHDRVLHVLAEVDAGAPADRALANAFRRARDLGATERAQVKEEVYGLLRRRRQAQDALHRGMAALRRSLDLFDAPILLRLELLTHLALEGADLAALEARDRFAARRVPKLMARIVEGRLPASKASPEERVAVELSLPSWIYRRLAAALGAEEATRIGRALLERAPVTLRVDDSRLEREAFLAQLAEQALAARPTPHAPHGVRLETRSDLRDWAELQDARVEVQDEGSQLVALAVAPQPGDAVLDACAGAGGKTLALWSAMRGQGQLVALEPDKKKVDALKKRLGAAAAGGVQVIASALEELPEARRGTFDRVLVDAPCTGTGTLRRHPDLKWRLSESDLGRETGRQLRLLGSALAALKPGGLLIYATCSVLREENEAVVEAFVRTAPEVSPVALASLWGPDLSRHLGAGPMVRIGPGPDETGPDGFFVAALRRD